MRYTAWVVLEGDEPHGCSLSDISITGTRLDIDESKPIPDNFTLLLASNGSARRLCRVVWRKPRQIGVTFEKVDADAAHAGEQASLAPKPDANATAEPVETVNVDAKIDAKIDALPADGK